MLITQGYSFNNGSFLGKSTKNNIDAYILIAGQSNAIGTTDSQGPTRSELIGDIENAYIYNTSSYETLNYPANNKGGLFGCEMSLAYNYTRHTKDTLYIEKEAVSGSAIAVEAGRNDWNVTSNELIVDSKNALQRLKDLQSTRNSANPKFILIWIQGERDARIDEGLNYESNFNAFLAEHEAIQEFDLVIINVLTTQIYDEGGFPIGSVEKVNQAQYSIYASNPKKFKYLDMRKYALGSDNLHFTNVAQEQIGDECFKIIKSKFNL